MLFNIKTIFTGLTSLDIVPFRDLVSANIITVCQLIIALPFILIILSSILKGRKIVKLIKFLNTKIECCGITT